MAERSKALRSGRSPLLWAWVRIPLLTYNFLAVDDTTKFLHSWQGSRVAQWKRAGPITQRSVDRNYALLNVFSLFNISLSQFTVIFVMFYLGLILIYHDNSNPI